VTTAPVCQSDQQYRFCPMHVRAPRDVCATSVCGSIGWVGIWTVREWQSDCQRSNASCHVRRAGRLTHDNRFCAPTDN